MGDGFEGNHAESEEDWDGFVDNPVESEEDLDGFMDNHAESQIEFENNKITRLGIYKREKYDTIQLYTI